MAPLVLQSVEEYLRNENTIDKGAAEISTGITNKSYDILDICEKLQDPLTSDNVTQRVQGTLLLSRILATIPKDFLNEVQLDVLTYFYSSRLKDHHNVVPAVIEGIQALVEMDHTNGANIVKILRSFFAHTTCQSQMRNDRYKLFNIFKYISGKYVSDLKEMSADFICGIISSIDGERDPRNLDLIFTFMPEFIATYPLLHLNEEMFEIFACYFPIDFTPTLIDPTSITRDTLAEKLNQCLIASPDFIEWTVDLALEKLSSDLKVAKRDSINLLYHTVSKYPSKLLEAYFEKIWLALKAEIFSNMDDKEISIAMLRILSTVLVKAGQEDSILSHKYQTIVFGTILTHLSDVSQSLFEPCARIALCCVRGDATFAGDKLLRTFLIKLNETKLTIDKEEEEEEEHCLRIYNVIAEMFSITFCTSKTEAIVSENISSTIYDEVHELVLHRLQNVITQHKPNNDFVCSSLKILKESMYVLSENSREFCYKILMDSIKHDTLDISDETSEFLKHLSKKYPDEVYIKFTNICIEQFYSLSNFGKQKLLNNLIVLIEQLEFRNRILDLIYGQTFDSNVCKEERLLSVKAFSKLLQHSDHLLINQLQHDTDLINKYINLANTQNDGDILKEIELALTLIMQSLNVSEQNTIIDKYIPYLNICLNNNIYVAKGLLGFIQLDVRWDEQHFEALLNDLIQLSLDSESNETRQAAHKLLCSLVNKCNYKKAQNKNILERVINRLKKAIKDGKEAAVEAFAWLAKGLIICGSDAVEDIIEELTNLLKHPTLGHVASDAFGIIANEYSQLHLPVTQYLFQQKFFHLVLKQFSIYLETFSEQYLSAFVYVIKMTPYAVLNMNAAKICEILLNTLKLTNVDTLKISLKICRDFIRHNDEHFLHHLDTLITITLTLSQFKNSMEVRIAALNVLFDIAKYPPHALLPYKLDVILGLGTALDDKKRLVRKAAVNTSNAWHLINLSTSD